MPRLALTRPLVFAAMTAVVLAAGAPPAAAQTHQQELALRAVTGRVIAAPRPEALATRLPVLVRIRVPAGTTRLRVRVGTRDVTTRFRRARGSIRVAKLTRGNGLRYGTNHLSVLAERGSRRPVVHARSFVLARRDANLARLRLRGGPVTALAVRVAGGVRLAAPHFGLGSAVERRLSVIRRERTVRLWLNGRRVTRALDRSQPTRWTAKLSATHGLRHGVNRIRLLVAEPDRGRFVLVRRRFMVSRNRHLAGAGWDVASRVRGRVRLDGRGSRAARGGRIRHTWKILSKPRGSRTKLRRVHSARPSLTPDRRGRYVIGLTVSDRGSGSRAAGSSTDRVAVTSTPGSLLLPFVGGTGLRASWGVQVGDAFFEDYQDPSGRTYVNYMQWLTLDRASLTPVGNQNSWFDSAADPSSAHGLRTLAAGVSAGDSDQLVVLSRHAGVAPLRADQVDAFNDVMATLGVGRIDPAVLTRRQSLVIVGVPSGQKGSGWYTFGDSGWDLPGDRGLNNVLTGWLMPDVALHRGGGFNYRLQPDRPVFDTSSSSTPTTNRMTLGGQSFDATLPSPATGGFQVVVFDPFNLDVVNNQVFATDGVADPKIGLAAMAKFLNDQAGLNPHIAVQSIGDVQNPLRPSGPYAEGATDQLWRTVGSALTFYGANPHTFYNASGSYAFVGGPQLDRSEVAQSSSAIVVAPTPPVVRQAGTLRGRARMRDDGYFEPVVTTTTEAFQESLNDIVFRPQTPWPYTPGGDFPHHDGCDPPGNDAAAYTAALTYVTSGIGLPSTPDLRAQYVTRDQDTWSDQKVDLGNLPYASGKGFSQAEYCNLKAQLQLEFDWLDNVKELFDAYKDALNRSGSTGSADLQSIGKGIRDAIGPSPGEQILWTVGGFIGNMGSAAILAYNPEATAVLAAWEGLVTVYELGREVVSTTVGDSTTPVGDRITSRADELEADVANHLFDVANSLDRLRDVIISDYGRLNRLGPHTNEARWKIDPGDTATRLRTAASAFFYTELMPIAWDTIWYLMPSSAAMEQNVPQTADDCEGGFFTHPWRGAPATGQVDWRFDVLDPEFGPDRGGRSILGSSGISGTFAPASLTDVMFGPVSRNKFGVYLPDFLWTKVNGMQNTTFACQPE